MKTSFKFLKSDQGCSTQAGAGLIALMMGAAIFGFALVMISNFFLQSKLQARVLQSEADTLAHSAVILRQAITDNCSRLAVLKTTFLPTITEPTIVKERSDLSSEEATSLMTIMNKPKSPLAKANGGVKAPSQLAPTSSYSLTKIAIVQKSNILGKSPARVLAELKVNGLNNANKKPWQFTVPLVFDLDNMGGIDDCLRDPDVSQMCKERGGSYTDEDYEKPCAI